LQAGQKKLHDDYKIPRGPLEGFLAYWMRIQSGLHTIHIREPTDGGKAWIPTLKAAGMGPGITWLK